MTTIVGGRVVIPGGVLDPGWLQIHDGRITAVGAGPPPDDTHPYRPPDTPQRGDTHPYRPSDTPQRGDTDACRAEGAWDVGGRWVLPGFVDLHVHGGGGAGHQDGDAAEVARVVELHRGHGTTTMLASLVTAPLADLERSVAALAELTADGLVAGVHLEGPFLAEARCGAHDPTLLRPPAPDDLARLLRAGRGAVRMVTLAPELDGALAAVERLAGDGVIAAVGHTDATHAGTVAAIGAGARVATHLFNGMRGLHHREPGPVLALMDDERVTVELINDGVHLHPALVASVVRTVGPARVAFITDAMSAAGVGDGDYTLGGLPVRVRDGVARLTDGGKAVAGSTLTMDVALRNAVAAGLAVPDVAHALATTPAAVLGLDTGALVAGRAADLVVLDHDLTVHSVMHRGVMHRGTWV